MIETAAMNGVATHAVPVDYLREVGEISQRCRDQIFDLLVRLSQQPTIDGLSLSPELVPDVWDSLDHDPDPFLMGLDFYLSEQGPRLARVVGPWACLPQAIHQDHDLRLELSRYLQRRFGPNGMISIRTLDYGSPYGDGRVLAKAANDAGFEAQWAHLTADWLDSRELKGAWVQAPLVGAQAGLFSMPPADLPLFAPLWTMLLDEPGLMVYLAQVYPQEEVYGNAWFGLEGRTLMDQTGVPMNATAGVIQDLGYSAPTSRLDLVRYFVDDERVLGCSMLQDAQLRHAASGVVTGVKPQWAT